jgi:DNA-binding CsgD family transcriptional regulator
MNTILFISIAIFVSFISAGIYVFSIDPKSSIHRSFSLMFLLLAASICAGIIMNITDDPETCNICAQIGLSAEFFLFPTILLFCLLFTNTLKMKPYYLFLIYFCPTVFFILNTCGYSVFYQEIMLENGRWGLRFTSNKIIFISYLVFLHICFILFSATLIRWGIKAKMKRQKKQAFILFATLFVSSVFSAVESIYLPSILQYNSGGLSFVGFIFFAAGLYIIFIKYRFPYLSSKQTVEDVLSDMGEIIIILDNTMRIRFMNKTAETLFEDVAPPFNRSMLSSIMLNHKKLVISIEKILSGESSSFSCREYFGKSNRIQLDFSFSAIKDEFNDTIGVMVKGTEVDGIQLLTRKYKITQREAEIIEHLITGETNAEISKSCSISENTIKRHITNIYNKLSVRSRVELLYMLKDHILVSKHIKDRTFMLVDKN